MMRRIVFLCLLLLAMQKTSHACFCGQSTVIANSADVIFRGELVEHKGRFAIFRVDEQWKGNPGEMIQVEWREGSHGDCNGF